MTDTTTVSLRVKEIPEVESEEALQAGFYWTLDEGPEAECFWSGPHANPEAAKASAIEAITAGYLAAATMTFNGE